MILSGRPVHPGVAVGATRLLTSHDLIDLHHSERHAQSDQELKEIFRSPAFRVHALSDLAGTPEGGENQRSIIEVTFWSAVNDILESRGSGIVFAVASVISRYLRSAIFSLDPKSQEEFRCLSEFGKSVLSGLVKFRKTKYSTSPSYIVLAVSLDLPEAVSLEPRIVGYAVGSSIDPKLRIAAELLEVPAVAGIKGVEEHALLFRFARLDGGKGTLEAVPPGSVTGNG